MGCSLGMLAVIIIGLILFFFPFEFKKVHHLKCKQKIQQVQENIGVNGGTVQVSDESSEINGFRIHVPPDSYPQETKFTVSTREITGHDFGEYFHPVTPLIIVKNKAGYAKEPLTIDIPVHIKKDEFAMAFYYTETGTLEALPLIHQDSENLIISTKHFSEIVVSSIKNAELENLELDTGFKPGVDDWSFTNYGSQVSPGGYCAGQTASMAYYYYEKRLQGAEPLYTAYDNNHQPQNTPEFSSDDSMGIRLASVVQKGGKWSSYYFKYLRKYIHKKSYVSDRQLYNAFGYAMLLTGDPQQMGLFERTANAEQEIKLEAGHAILAYKLTANKIYVCDPNYPGNTNLFVPFDGKNLGPYVSTTSTGEPDSNYNSFSILTKSALFDWENIGVLFTEIEKPANESTIGDDKFSSCTYKVIVDYEKGNPIIAEEPQVVIFDDISKARIREACKSYFPHPRWGDWDKQDYFIIEYKVNVPDGVIRVYSGTKNIVNYGANAQRYTTVLLPLHKGLNDMGIRFDQIVENGNHRTNRVSGCKYNFIDFIRFQVQNGEEDISGTWTGHIQIGNMDNTLNYAEALSEQIARGLSVIIQPLLDEPITEEQIREAAKAGVTVNEAALEPMPLTVVFKKIENTDQQYTALVSLTFPTESGSQISEISTKATYESGTVRFSVPYDDGSVSEYILKLIDHDTAAGEFEAKSGGVISMLSGTCDIERK
jgi:hypothetical protein